LRERGVERFGLRIHQAGEYPAKLRDARDPVELLYFQGTWELVETRCVAIVGSRKPSDEGRKRARRLARALVQDDFTVVSGLATGIDTEAHTTAIEAGGRTIGADGRARASVGNTVDVANATWTNTIGAGEMITVWKDPDFDPTLRGFYYVRVIEIPTPRWTARRPTSPGCWPSMASNAGTVSGSCCPTSRTSRSSTTGCCGPAASWCR